jgi:acyl-CoA synthetase (AMP-forming)/AMP-acid ligase II
MTAPCSAPRRISEFVERSAARNPAGEALVLGDARWSYLELQQRVDALARALLAAGVRKGDRVATLQTPHPQYLVCFLATASIGAIWVGLNPKSRLEELAHAVVDAQPRILFTRLQVGERSYAGEIESLRGACPSLERVVSFEHEPAQPGVEPMQAFLREGREIGSDALYGARYLCGGRDPCLIVYTSGSTGKPKGALLHHEGIGTFAVAQNELWPVDPLRIVNYFPINHVGSTIDICIPCLAAGGTIVFMEQFDPSRCTALMAREKITVWASVPSVFAMQLALPDLRREDFAALQLVIWEGAAMPLQLVRQLLQLHPRLATNYGMTETTSAITALEPTGDAELLADTVGSAFPGIEIRLVDAEGREVGEGQEGEVLVRSAQNMLGYWRNADATRAAFTDDGFFRTGDLAVRRPDGRYRLVGRLKEMFKSGGYNVYPREVEGVLEAHPGVENVAVVPAPDPLWQEVGVAFVVPKAAIDESGLKSWCAGRLSNYKVPKRFVIRDSLPLLPIGKVDKGALRAIAKDLP